MSTTWTSEAPPKATAPGALGWARALVKGAIIGTVTFGGLALLLLVRLVERPLHGMQRPWTPWITQAVCRTAIAVIGMRYIMRGRVLSGQGAIVANHSSWLDIFVLNARSRIYFVSKSEVASWPGIGWLARATGTLFINRDRKEARLHQAMLEDRLKAGHKLLFFPEGTSTDGMRVLPFKTTLFAAFLTDELRETLSVQPITVIYRAPEGADPRFYGWWGEMSFGGHLMKILAAPRHGSVEVICHPPISVSEAGDRKSLAAAAETSVRDAMPPERQIRG